MVQKFVRVKEKIFKLVLFYIIIKKNLENINFKEMIIDMQRLADDYKEKEKINEEIILVLIVYETPNNPCSERIPLQQYFTEHGWECKELKYPIDLFKN